jgi:hypothetical protein
MTTENQKKSGVKKFLMWVSIVFGVFIVFSAILGDDDEEESSDTNTSIAGSNKSTGKFGVGKWKATYTDLYGNHQVDEITFFQDGTAIIVWNGETSKSGYWKKENKSEYGVAYEWIEVHGSFSGNFGHSHYVDLNGNAYFPFGKAFPECVRAGKPDYRFTRIE